MSADARHCEQLARRHARTFALASRFLPAEKRRAAFALYAFCRVADDLVDAADACPQDAARGLADLGASLERSLAGAPDGPVMRELVDVVDGYGLPPRVLRELLHGVSRDLEPVRYETWRGLAAYCEGVASSVGEMCTHVFGVPGGDAAREEAIARARTLGVAMQLTNILRDVGEDGRRGRCYLPEEDLARFELDRADVLAGAVRPADPRWVALMTFQIERARRLYDDAAPGIGLLAPDAQRCARACAVGYAGILGAIERIGFDTFGQRARLGAAERAAVLWQVWRAPLAVPPLREAPRAEPRVEPRVDSRVDRRGAPGATARGRHGLLDAAPPT